MYIVVNIPVANYPNLKPPKYIWNLLYNRRKIEEEKIIYIEEKGK